MTRRAVLGGMAAAAGVAAAPWIVPASALGADGAVAPSERIGIGLIGRGAMGSGHLRRMINEPRVQVLAVCEVDRLRRDTGKNDVEQAYAADRASGTYRGCAAYNDYRELLARTDIDAVIVATPDHWHSLQSIDAAKAGKDVYCEKPISLTVQQGRRLVEAVCRYGRVFQTGTQYRSIPTIRQVCGFIRGGGLGKVASVFTNVNNLASFIGGGRYRPYNQVLNVERTGGSYVALDYPLPAESVPEGLDWEMWLGPAPWRPFHHLYHENPSPGVVPWSFCEDFGVTSLTWNLAHAADVIQYALGVETTGPVEIFHPRTGPYPTLTCKYANGTLLHFVDNWEIVKSVYKAVPAAARLAGNFGGVVVGERGWLTTMSTGGPVEGEPASLLEELRLSTREVVIGQNDHHANWLDAIATRKQPSCDEELGHRSASLGHVALAAYKLGRSLRWDPAKEQFLGDEEANRLCWRPARAPWRI
ncbi:MAG: Gfo/Idh/MocA family protein [Pirellulales bacterium]